MYERTVSDDGHEALTDDENTQWISDLPEQTHPFVQRLYMEGLAFDNKLKRELAETMMRTGGTRGGRQADRVLEAVKDHPETQIDENRVIDMPISSDDSGEPSDSEDGGGLFAIG